MKYVYDELPTESYFSKRLAELATKTKELAFVDSEESDAMYDEAVDSFYEIAEQYMRIHYPYCNNISVDTCFGYISSVGFHEFSGGPIRKFLNFED